MVDGDGRSFEDGRGDALSAPRDALDGPHDPGPEESPDTGRHDDTAQHHDPAVSTALDRPASSLPEVVATPPTAQHFQDLIALRRQAEESAAAALSERREATSQASRIIEEAMRAAEMLQTEARQTLEQHRSAAETEAAAILERARAEAAEIVQAGAHDVLEAQRLRREAAAERDRVNSELERLRRTAQEELFSEANRHAARMDEIRTRVLHGVEAATVGVRDTVWESTSRPGGRFGDSFTGNVSGPSAAAYLSSTPEPVADPSALDAPSAQSAPAGDPADPAASQPAAPEPAYAPVPEPEPVPEPPAPEPTDDDDSSSFPWLSGETPAASPADDQVVSPESFVTSPPPTPQRDQVEGQGSAPVQPPADSRWERPEPRRRGWRSRRS